MDYIWRAIGLRGSSLKAIEKQTEESKCAYDQPFFLTRPPPRTPGDDFLDTLDKPDLLESWDDHFCCSVCKAFLVHRFALPQHVKDVHSGEISLIRTKDSSGPIDTSSRRSFKKPKVSNQIITRSRSRSKRGSTLRTHHPTPKASRTNSSPLGASLRRGSKKKTQDSSITTAASGAAAIAATTAMTTITPSQAPTQQQRQSSLSTPPAVLEPGLEPRPGPGTEPGSGQEPGAITISSKMPFVHNELANLSSAANVTGPSSSSPSSLSLDSLPSCPTNSIEFCFLCYQEFTGLGALKQHILKRHSHEKDDVSRSDHRSNNNDTLIRPSATIAIPTTPTVIPSNNATTAVVNKHLTHSRRAS
ncbi:hypothetical protein BCR43DRAFT_503504 [Syncephalastrum racemosum]|uniref:C2H2-type domain-containing protein n=1 Tax=Syncephalastrum racemosum TaxID=13706 RepID=A0A1X2HI56_SYNRA|nr:hypothetical protein BCR43DRAFT_503504 [Syncephalastrum racemosum]